MKRQQEGNKFPSTGTKNLTPFRTASPASQPGTTFSVQSVKTAMERNENNRQIPENDNSKAMDSKREVAQSKDEKTDQDFPGYPHYPAKEDIMDQRTDSQRVDVDIEKLASGRNSSGVSQRFANDEERTEQNTSASAPQGNEDDLEIRMGNEADVTEDELSVLNSTDAEIGTPQNVSNEELESDLDVPGSELDDDNEKIGEEDEENNYYSLGGDRHEGQEEDPNSGPNRGND